MATETVSQATCVAAEESAQANAREFFRLNATYLVARTARRGSYLPPKRPRIESTRTTASAGRSRPG